MAKILIMATHTDDEVLGCGGTIARHVGTGDEVFLCVITRGFPPDYDEAVDEENRREAMRSSVSMVAWATIARSVKRGTEDLSSYWQDAWHRSLAMQSWNSFQR